MAGMLSTTYEELKDLRPFLPEEIEPYMDVIHSIEYMPTEIQHHIASFNEPPDLDYARFQRNGFAIIARRRIEEFTDTALEYEELEGSSVDQLKFVRMTRFLTKIAFLKNDETVRYSTDWSLNNKSQW